MVLGCVGRVLAGRAASGFALSRAALGGNHQRVWCNRPVLTEPFPSRSAHSSSIAAIGQIVAGEAVSGVGPVHAPRRRSRCLALAPAFCALAIVLSMSSEALAARISLLGFEGDSARALRWRIAGALKRAGHTVVGFAPPKDPGNTAMLRSFAKRRRVDVFVSGESVHGSDGWELTLTLKDAEGDALGKGVTFTAGSLREMILEIKENGESRLDRAVSGGSSASAGAGRDADSDGAAADFAGSERARAKRKKGKGGDPAPKSRDVEEPINLDDGAADDSDSASGAASEEGGATFDADEGKAAEEKPRAARAKGWAKSSASATPAAPEDDARSSFLSDTSADESSDGSEEVGVDEGSTSSDSDASASGDPTVILGLNAGFVRRTLGYSDDLYGRLRAPSVNAWVYRLQAAVYPFARPVKNRIGLIAGYESEFSGVVRDANAGTDFGVTFSELYGGLKLRQPLGKHEIAFEGTVGSLQAGLDDPEGQSGVPEFSYTSLRAALDVGLQFGGLGLRGALGYRLPIGGYGQASEADWFPRMEGYGMEGTIGASYRISKEVAFDISGSFRRFLLQMNSQPTDALEGVSEVAGGAVDLYLGGYFGLNITL
jgi:hypothetical protein